MHILSSEKHCKIRRKRTDTNFRDTSRIKSRFQQHRTIKPYSANVMYICNCRPRDQKATLFSKNKGEFVKSVPRRGKTHFLASEKHCKTRRKRIDANFCNTSRGISPFQKQLVRKKRSRSNTQAKTAAPNGRKARHRGKEAHFKGTENTAKLDKFASGSNFATPLVKNNIFFGGSTKTLQNSILFATPLILGFSRLAGRTQKVLGLPQHFANSGLGIIFEIRKKPYLKAYMSQNLMLFPLRLKSRQKNNLLHNKYLRLR